MVNHKVKLCMLGSSGVGKSSLGRRIVSKENIDISKIEKTIGLDFMTAYYDVNGDDVKLDVWDTSGQERFIPIIRSYFRSADAYLLVYDVSNYVVYDDIDRWLNKLRENTEIEKPIYLVGNKIDLINSDKFDNLTKYKNFHVSVKNGTNVDDMIEYILNHINLQPCNTIDISQPQPKQSNKCC
jgi:small GTP-binding protein